jgi:hypothetical protein
MANLHGCSNSKDAEPSVPPTDDPLGILRSARLVVEQGEHVWINPEQVDALCAQWIQTDTLKTATLPAPWDTHYHFYDGTERTVNWILVLDALNFCFWAEKDQPRWGIEYAGERLNGYWAEAAALKRAVEEGIPLWDASFLSTISDDVMASILRSTPDSIPIPLFEQRICHAREVGQVLLTLYDGQFAHVIEQAYYDAVSLVQLLVEHFPSFRDSATYRNHEVRFFKRAQICAADLYNAFAGKQWGALHNLDQLTCFADYKLPQVLRHYSVIEYAPALARRVDHQELLQAGSEEEIEIRATTIWACELLRRTLLQHGRVVTAAGIDQLLWLVGQQVEGMRPYHRTRTIYY